MKNGDECIECDECDGREPVGPTISTTTVMKNGEGVEDCNGNRGQEEDMVTRIIIIIGKT